MFLMMDLKYLILVLFVTYSTGAKLGNYRVDEIEEYIKHLSGSRFEEAPRRHEADRQQNTDPFTFDDIFSGEFRPRSFSSQWFDVHTLVYMDGYGNLVRHDPEENTIDTLVSNTTFITYNTGTYFVSADLRYVLLASNATQVWRHSYTATYVIVDANNNTVIHDVASGEVLQYASWAPSGNSLSYVTGNNLYYQAGPDVTAEQVTEDGDLIARFNGIPDWLYEEDVLSSRVAHYWAPNAEHICYATFDDTNTPSIRYPFYGDKTQVYPQTVQIRYPKAGDVSGNNTGNNTQVTLTVVPTDDVDNKIAINPPDELLDEDHYFTRASWVSDVILMVTWTNRVQTHAYVVTYDLTNTSDVINATNHELTVDGGWIDSPWPSPVVARDESYYISVQPQRIENNETWAHVAHISLTEAPGDVTFLTTGQHEVMSIVSLDEENGRVYFLTTGGNSTERHLFYQNLTGTAGEEECLTCHVNPEECAFFSASMSSDHLYYMLTCSGPGVPTYTLYHINGTLVEVFEDNTELKNRLATKALPTRRFIQLELGDGYTGEAEIFIPPNRMEGEVHPLLVYAYGGPGSQRIYSTFPMGSYINNWLMYLKSSHRVVVASVDSRGASGKGQDFRYLMYKKLGTVEVWDQIMAGEQFIAMDEVNDDANAAIFGWSYGGMVSALSLANDTSPYQCGISVAPVSSKRYYDTAYTERYMGLATPNDNSDGYDNTDVMDHAALFANKTFLVAHGTDDDNVHFQHFTQLVKALVEHEIQFRQMIYVDENHSIQSLHGSRHLFRGLTNFLLQDCGWDSDGDGTGDHGTEPSTPQPTVGSAGSVTGSVTLLIGVMFMAVVNKFVL